MSVPTIDELAELVRTRAREQSSAARLSEAIELGRGLADTADLLIEHFVADARADGLSWAQIGELFGTSKQAAQKRYGGGPIGASQRAPTARDVLDLAGHEARALGHDYVGTEHALLALLGGRRDVAEQVLAELGVTREAVLSQITPSPDPRPYDRMCVMPRLKRALENARLIADGLGLPGPGAEHVLAGIVAVPDAVAVEILARIGATADDVRATLASRLGVDPEQLAVTRPRRRRLLARAS